MLADLKEGFGKGVEKLAPPAALMFMSYFLGIFAVALSLYVFANQVNAKSK